MSLGASLSVVKSVSNLPITWAAFHGYDGMRQMWRYMKFGEIVKDTNNAGYVAAGAVLRVVLKLPLMSDLVAENIITGCCTLLLLGRFNKMIEKTVELREIWYHLKPTSLYREIKYSFTASHKSSKVQKDNSWLLFKTPQKIASLVIDFGCALFSVFNSLVDVLEAARFDDHSLDNEAVILAFKNFADVTQEEKVDRLLGMLDENEKKVTSLLEAVGIEKHTYRSVRIGLEDAARTINNFNKEVVNVGHSMLGETKNFFDTAVNAVRG